MKLATFPAWMQAYWSWLTAISLPGERRWRWEARHHIARAVILAVVAASTAVISAQHLLTAAFSAN